VLQAMIKSGATSASGHKFLTLVAGGVLAFNTAWGQGQGWLGGFDYATPYTFVTIAGTVGQPDSADGTNQTALFNQPTGLAVDTNGNVYVADFAANVLRKMTQVGTNWVVTTIAGQKSVEFSADGTNQDITFGEVEPAAVAADQAGNLYVTDTIGIRELTLVGTNWVSSTIAGGLYQTGVERGSSDGTNGMAQFNDPEGIAVDASGVVYVADTANDTIRRVAPVGTNWVVTTIAGTVGNAAENDGTNHNGLFDTPVGIAVDRFGNLFVADTGASTAIRKVSPVGTNWVVTTLASSGSGQDGTNLNASFSFINQLAGITVDASDNLYIADSGDYLVRKMSPQGTNWVTTTLAGNPNGPTYSDGTGTNAVFYQPAAIAIDASGRIFLGDAGASTILEGTLFRVTPNLAISHVAPSVLTVSWLGSASALQTNASLVTTNWGIYGGTVNTNNGTNSVTVTAPSGTLFFRLSQ
ncbi:MAG: hypothetical protein WCF77_00160, partial [Minisyncoccia bacterium]